MNEENMEDNELDFEPVVVSKEDSRDFKMSRQDYAKKFFSDNEEEKVDSVAKEIEQEEEVVEVAKELEDEFFSDKDLKKKAKIKVYGEEKEVELEELIKRVQIADATEKKLQNASLKEKQLEELTNKYNQLLEQQLADKIQKEHVSKSEPTFEEEDGLKKAFESLTEYDVDKAVSLFRKELNSMEDRRVNATKVQPEIKIDEITNQIKTQLEVENTYNKFVNDNLDLTGHQYFETLLNEEMKKLNGSGLSFEQALNVSNGNIRKALNINKVEKIDQVSAKDNSLDDLKAKKEAAKSIAVNSKQLSNPKVKTEESVDPRGLYFNTRKKVR